MYTRIVIFFTKLLVKLLRLLGKNASALPGLVVEKISPKFLDNVLKPVEHKIVLITGTNGKTTTTKMVVHGLRSAGRKVVTNSTGSNMTRGLISALLEDMTFFGSLRPTDWFVFEMDEAYAPKFVENLSIHSVLALNVLRDQLDRYGEIDTTARYIKAAASKSANYVFNTNDRLLSSFSEQINSNKTKTISFGVVNKLTSKMRTEQNMYTNDNFDLATSDFTLYSVTQAEIHQKILVEHKHEQIEFLIPIEGIHNALNATGACALLFCLENDEYKKMIVAINTMPTPFGRGEILKLGHKQVTVALVKNPSGFSHNLETFVVGKEPEAILFVVNDRFADGRDVSWLWDVEFKSVIPAGSSIVCSGIRAYDMAVRLKQDGYEPVVEVSVGRAVDIIMSGDERDVVIIPTYTALYEVRSELTKYGKVPRIW